MPDTVRKKKEETWELNNMPETVLFILYIH